MVNAAYPRSRSQVAAMAIVKMPTPVEGNVVISHKFRRVTAGQPAIIDSHVL